MKNILLFGVGLAMLVVSCKEIGPSIDLAPKDISDFDTSYTEAVPAPQQKMILVEEYTGVQCPNCPAGAEILRNYEEAHPGKIIIVGLHGGALTDPIKDESKYNFKNNDVQNMVNSYLLGGTPPKPAAAVDRVDFGGGLFIVNKNEWPNKIDQRSSATTPVNITLASEYDSILQKVIVNVKLVYTKEVPQKQNLSLWVIEDGIVDAQINETKHIPDYVHNHVLRDFITPIIGASILDSVEVKTPGMVLERRIVYTPKFLTDSKLDKWNLDNCKIVAVVHNNELEDREVSQVVEVNLK